MMRTIMRTYIFRVYDEDNEEVEDDMVNDTPLFLCQKCRLETVHEGREDRPDWTEEDKDQPVDWPSTGLSE